MAALLGEKAVTSSFGARFSIPFALATILYHGRSGLDSFNEAAVANGKIQALAARVAVEEDPAFTAAYPPEQRCIVTLRLKRGETVEGKCTVMRGEPGNPHKASELEHKFFDLSVPIWGKATAEELYNTCMRLEELSDFRAWSTNIAL
jgi:2-methylcitrate dehydratase PrpD